MITQITPPVWNPDKREWVINYGVSDYVDDRPVKYVQKVLCEALVSAERITQMIKDKMR